MDPSAAMAGEEKMTPPVVAFQSMDACEKEFAERSHKALAVKKADRITDGKYLTISISI
tara:strand:+ start:231 stop:407 length:177 start_codon:yes stop_codon:yes gene_type:complete